MIQLLRDPRTLGLFLSAPVLLTLMFGYALSFDVRHLRMVVYDQDRTAHSRRLVESLVQSKRFDLVAYVSSEEMFCRFLDYGRAQVGIKIPPSYSRDLHSERESAIQVILDGTDPQAANVALFYARDILTVHAQRIAFASLTSMRAEDVGKPATARAEPLDVRVRVWYNPDLRDADFLIPGVVGLITSLLTMNLSIFSVVRERERGTFEQLIVTPLRQVEVIFGKLIPYATIAFVNACLVITTGYLLFDVPIRGSLILLMGLTLLFIIGSLGAGLLVSTVSQTQAQVLPVILLNYLPNTLLSGFIFPIDSMPAPIQPLTQVIPLTHYLVIVRGVMLKGMGIDAFLPQFTYLTIFCFGILTLSTLLFRKKLL
jgi:ABC-2 type transport system permease protein